MGKKMTEKEFFEIADKALLCVYDFEDVLACIECETWCRARFHEEKGDSEYANILKRRARYMHSELTARGYYEE